MPDHLGAPAPFPVLTAAAAATTTLHVGTFVLNAQGVRGRRTAVPTARERVDHLEHTTTYLAEHVPGVRMLIAGNGDRLLTVAARHADIIGLTGGDRAAKGDDDPLAERIAFVRAAAGERFGRLELNIAITAMPLDDSGRPDLTIPRRFLPGLSDDQLLRHPGVLSGTPPGHGRPAARVPQPLRHLLRHRAGAARRRIREGDSATALNESVQLR